MFANLFFLIVFIGLTGLFGWLTYRAVRAQRLWVKIAGGLGAGLLTLVLAAVFLAGARGFTMVYFPGADPAPSLTVEGTPAQIARGEYLANISCIGCHGSYTEGSDTATYPLAGGFNISEEEGFGFIGAIITENLTPGGKLAEYSDGELFRSLRSGVDRDGHLLAFMPVLPYSQLSDEDLKALIAFMRAQPAVPSAGATGDHTNFIGLVFFGAGMFPSGTPVNGILTAPPVGATAEYGEYVATFGECRGCHGPDMTGTEASAFAPAVPSARVFVGAVTLAEFIQTMRTGVRPNGSELDMPWQNASKMTDEDLAALYAYLTAKP